MRSLKTLLRCTRTKVTSTSLRNVITRGTWSQTKSWQEYHKVGGKGLRKMLSRKSRKNGPKVGSSGPLGFHQRATSGEPEE